MQRRKALGDLEADVRIRVERGGEPITLTAKREAFDVFYAAAAPGGCVAEDYNADLNFPLPFTADALSFHSTVHIEYRDINNVKRTYIKDIIEASSGHNTLSLETELQIRNPYPRRDHSFGRAWLTWDAQTVTGTTELGVPVRFGVVAGSTPGVFSGEDGCNNLGVYITATSPIPLYFCAGGDSPKRIPHTVSTGIRGEASQLLSGTTEDDILEYYHVDFLEERVFKTVSNGYDITATWNLGNKTVHFELKAVAQVTVDIPASIAAGGIPEAIKTGRDEEFTFVIRNQGASDEVVDLFLTFENHDIPRIYPHDLTGLVPTGSAYTLPGSGIYVLNDAFAASYPVTIKAGESGTYTLTVQLPHDAIPPGMESIGYGIYTKVATYM